MSGRVFRRGRPPPLPVVDISIRISERDGDGLAADDLLALGFAGGGLSASDRSAHDAVAAFCRQHDGWWGMTRLRRADGPEVLDGCKGVVLEPRAAGLPGRRLLEEINERRLPTLIPSGRLCPPAWIAHKLLPRLETTVILGHLGSRPCEERHLRHAVGLARSHANVFLETSLACIGNFITFAAREVPEKILFGSHAPVCSPHVQWAHVAAAVDHDATLERIAHKTARALFGHA